MKEVIVRGCLGAINGLVLIPCAFVVEPEFDSSWKVFVLVIALCIGLGVWFAAHHLSIPGLWWSVGGSTLLAMIVIPNMLTATPVPLTANILTFGGLAGGIGGLIGSDLYCRKMTKHYRRWHSSVLLAGYCGIIIMLVPHMFPAKAEWRLQRAIWRGDHKTAHRLLSKGIAIDDSVTQMSGTPLHWAASTGDVSTVRLLIQKRVEIDVQDKTGMTPLHHAVIKCYTEVVKLLLENDADRHIQDIWNKTPLQYGDYCQDEDLRELLHQSQN